LDHETIRQSTAYGLAIPIPVDPYPLESREADLLKIVAQYVRRNHVNLEQSFGLSSSDAL
jgi:hypothetical protein